MFDRKRPCSSCPFTVENARRFNFNPERIEEILNAPAFQCHKTVDYDHYDDPEGRQGDTPQKCAGLMALLHDTGRPNHKEP